MSTTDLGGLGMIDAAGIAEMTNSAVDVNVDATPEVDLGAEADVETTDTGAAEGAEDGAEEGSEGADKAATDKDGLSGEIKDVKAIRSLLKTMRETADPNTPEGKQALAAVKSIRYGLERWNAVVSTKDGGLGITGGFDQIRQMKALHDSVGGQQGYENIQNTIKAVQASDQKLYNGDASLISDIVEDLKSEGKLDSLAKIAGPMLDAISKNDPKGYARVADALFLRTADESGLTESLNKMHEALSSGNVKAAQQILQAIGKWASGKYEAASVQGQAAEETKKLEQQKSAWAQEQRQTEWKGIVSSAEKTANSIIASTLKQFIRLPYFASFKQETWAPVLREIRNDLAKSLNADKAFQQQITGHQNGDKRDRDAILSFYKNRLEQKGFTDRIVREAIIRLHPNYASNSAAQGRIAAAAQKKAADAKAVADQKKSGMDRIKPGQVPTTGLIYVAKKPEWNSIDWSADPNQYAYAAGKCKLLGSGKWVTWRK